MKWKKKGVICSHETFKLDWYKKNSMVPIPYLTDAKTLRIFLTMCDKNNVGRIGYVDVNPDNPSEILNYSKVPVLDIGEDGAFDDNGVVTASVFEEDEKIYLFYSGYQLAVKVPYFIFTGLSISKDRGNTFERFSRAPLLDRNKAELMTRCVPEVIKEDDKYRMFYAGDYKTSWVEKDGKKKPCYNFKYLYSNDLKSWPNTEGQKCIDLAEDGDEHGIAKATVWKEDNKYKMIYSIRSLSKGYRLGYAESENKIDFSRMDNKVGIDVSENGFDSEMICFPSRFQYNDKIYLFYCGNHYGMAGFGYAELIEK
jgi:hypothetical protein